MTTKHPNHKTKIVEIAETQFGLPIAVGSRLKSAYLAYLGEQLRSTCGPNIWPPLSFSEWKETR